MLRKLQRLFCHKIDKIGPFENFVTDLGTEYFNSVKTTLSIRFQYRHSLRISHDFCTIGFDEVQKKNNGTHLCLFLYDAPENWSVQALFSVYAYIMKIFQHLSLSRMGFKISN